MATILETKEFVENGRSPFAEWFDSLEAVTAARVDNYFAGLRREISARPKYFKKAYLN